MPLSNKLISQFVKTTNNTKKENKEKFVYGKICESVNGKNYVQIDGSLTTTPISRFTSDINKDERVIVMIKNHEAIVTGNVTETATTKTYVDKRITNISPLPANQSDIIALWDNYFKTTS